MAGVIAWVYRTANKRFGIIDLFSGEISTVCRVCTISDVIKIYADHLNNWQDPAFAKTASSEDYTIIFDTNSRELSVFDRSVIKRITQFYTYIKAFRDTTRGLVELHKEAQRKDGAGEEPIAAAWRGSVINSI